MTLTDILSPVSMDQFLRDYVGQQYLLVRGTPGRFRGLVSWQELNTVLSDLRVNDGRVILVKQGKGVPQSSYIHTSPSGRIQYLIGPSVRKHVLDGATLTVNQIDELVPAVRQLVESCEELFEVHVSANLYAGWRTDNGFDVHWDRHDALIVQVRGRKNWKVWAPTRIHPLGDDHADAAVPLPSEDPVWQGTLEDGDILYMPRGWWHVAWPRDEPSLHVTIGIKHPTGVDLLGWVIDRLKASIDVRRDVPHWEARDRRSAWVRALRASFVAVLHDDAVESYMDSVAAAGQPRPVVHLPEATMTPLIPGLDQESLLRLVRLRRLRLHGESGAGMLTFEANGRRWQCHELLRPALRHLHAVTPCTLGDMRRAVEERAKPLVRPFVTALVAADVVWAEAVLALTEESWGPSAAARSEDVAPPLHGNEG